MERAVYRIIDANFNRGREAARLIEEFCRFALNNPQLTARAKQIRHELSAAVDTLDADRLISGRDTLGDVGLGTKAKGDPLKRTDLKGCFTAGSKRLTEALRAIEEVGQTLNSPISKTVEKLRYEAYTLEKDIILFSTPAEKYKKVKLYIIITSNLPSEIISLTTAIAAGGADCIQLRSKNMADDKLFAVAVEFVRICKSADVLSIINDRVDIAVAAGADGVHFGQNDLPLCQARKVQLTPLIIGKSTHSLAQLQAACLENPTYVGLGPVFVTQTKPGVPAVSLDYVSSATEFLSNTGVGHAAIGGITLDNIDKVLSAGAQTISVCSAVTESGNPAAACKVFKEKIIANVSLGGRIPSYGKRD